MYDFDYTLCDGYMFEYGFLSSFGKDNLKYWEENVDLCVKHNMDNNLGYMYLLKKLANESGIKLTKEHIQKFGGSVKFYKGIESWFKRIADYGEKLGLEVEHYIISSGLKELIESTSIAKDIKRVFASSYAYDENGEAFWPSQVVNYTNKTQYIFRIKKNKIDNLYDSNEVNEYLEKDKKLPYNNMFYFGDGETDIPCMKLVKDKGGCSVCVYSPTKQGAKDFAGKILSDGRVNFVAEADYSEGGEIDKNVKSVLNKLATQAEN